MNGINTVLFDLDGTLIDTEKYFRRVWPQTLREAGFEMSDEQALSMRSLGRPYAPEHLKRMFGEGADYTALRARRKVLMEEMIAREGISLKKGAVELVTRLHELGFTAAIVTATDRERTERYLGSTELKLSCFDRFVSATMVEKGKPAPDVYLYALKELNKRPDECVAVEDAPNGILSAYRAGLRVITVPDQDEPDEELKKCLWARADSLEDIIPLLYGNNVE